MEGKISMGWKLKDEHRLLAGTAHACAACRCRPPVSVDAPLSSAIALPKSAPAT